MSLASVWRRRGRLIVSGIVLLGVAACTGSDPVSTDDDDPNPPPNNPPPPPPPIPNGITVVAAGNIAKCGGILGQASAAVVATENPDYVFLMGDIAYPTVPNTEPTLQDFMNCYDPSWGQFKSKTYAAVGTQDQDENGFSRGADAYFGVDRIGQPGKNYYSFDIGTWHIIVLNVVSGGPQAAVRYNNGSAQLNWLKADLAANKSKKCTLAFWHDPMWHSSNFESPTDPNIGYRRQPQRGVWMALYDGDADVVLGGGDHIYERFAPMKYLGEYEQTDNIFGPEYEADPVRGIRQFSSGLGGDGPLTTPVVATTHPLSEYRSAGNGVLKLTLGDGIYSWQFLNTQHSNVMDSGTGTCH